MNVTVYSKNHCVLCERTYRFFENGKVSYNTINIETDPTALDKLDEYGFESAPVVVVEYDDGNKDAWCGFRADMIKKVTEISQNQNA
jgi:glutaredoxin-like protein NrdH